MRLSTHSTSGPPLPRAHCYIFTSLHTCTEGGGGKEGEGGRREKEREGGAKAERQGEKDLYIENDNE